MCRTCCIVSVAFLVPLLSLTVAVTDTAAVTIYEESIGGDLPKMPVPFDPNIFPNFVLPEGESEFKGDLLAPEDPEDNEDWFQFVIPPGMKLPEIEIVIPPPNFVFPPALDLELYELDGPTSFVWTGGIIGESAPKNILLEPLDNGDPPPGDLGPGLYGMRMKAVDDPPWIVTFQLVAVPEPSTVLLSALALAGFALFVRRYRHRLAS